MEHSANLCHCSLDCHYDCIARIGVNAIPVLDNLSQVPIINNIIKVLTFREYSIDEGTYDADIKTHLKLAV